MAGLILLLAAWMVPLHFLPWPSWHSEIVAFASGFVLLGAAMLRDGPNGRGIQMPRLAWVLLAFSGVVLVQAATGLITFRGDALVVIVYVALCLAALISGYSYRQPGPAALTNDGSRFDLLRALAWTVLLGAFASCAIALIQVFDIWNNSAWIARTGQQRRPGGNLGQPNHLGTLVLMGLASLLYLWGAGRLSKVSTAVIFTLLSLGIATTESRTALLGLSLLCVWSLIGRERSALRLSRGALVGGYAVALSLFVSWPAFMSWIGVFERGAAVDSRAGLRLVVWPQLLEASVMRPWTGWGVRQVSQAHNAVADNYSIGEPYTYAHNIVLELAIGLGWPIAVLFVVLGAAWAWRRIRSATSLASWYCVAAILPVAVHANLEFPYAYAYFLLPVMLLLGILERIAGASPVPRIGVRTLAVPLVAATAVGAWTVVEYLAVEEDFRVARFEAFRIGQRPLDYVRPNVQLLTQLDALLDGARVLPREGMTVDELELAREVALRYPWPATQNRYALSLALNGSTSEAVRQLQVIRTLHGEKTYEEIRANWNALAAEKYPALAGLAPGR